MITADKDFKTLVHTIRRGPTSSDTAQGRGGCGKLSNTRSHILERNVTWNKEWKGHISIS